MTSRPSRPTEAEAEPISSPKSRFASSSPDLEMGATTPSNQNVHSESITTQPFGAEAEFPSPSTDDFNGQAGGTKLHQAIGAQSSGCIESIAVFFAWVFTVLCFPFVCCSNYRVVREYERAVIFRMGRLKEGSGSAKGPGTFLILPWVENIYILDIRTVTFDVPPQEILTNDAVTVSVDAVVYYRVYNPVMAVGNVENFNQSTQLLASAVLRNVLGTKKMLELLTERENIATTMQGMLDRATDPWGVKVERVEIKDVRLPLQLQRAMAAEAEATRDAKAKIIAAEGERTASAALKDASTVLTQSPAALQLRYLQTLTTIAAERNSTIIFPLPIDLLKPFLKSG